jgi:hypothetical protein
MKTPRTFKDLCADSRVEDYSDERSQGTYNEGIWLYLMPGWVTPEGSTQIHEQTVRECSSELADCCYQPEEWAGWVISQLASPSPQIPLLPAG